jgi:predicted ribosome quality control (RQC) complex YloA/Tae2 family protein
MKEKTFHTNTEQQLQSSFAQLPIWIQKFSSVLFQSLNTFVQKITASAQGHLILNLFKPGTPGKRIRVLLTIKKGESGIALSSFQPVSLQKPNSFVQIARKYLQGQKVHAAYACLSPAIAVVLELSSRSQQKEASSCPEEEGPQCLILDFDAKPPRVVLAKKFLDVPKRYESQWQGEEGGCRMFFESWCEWSEDQTKTKRRACFLTSFVGYCPLPEKSNVHKSDVENSAHIPQSLLPKASSVCPDLVQNKNLLLCGLQNPHCLKNALDLLPTHIRKSARTRLQFFARRLLRQKADLPDSADILRLQKQSEGLKALLYLWPQNSLVWYVPPEFIEKYSMPACYQLKKNQNPGSLLTELHHKIEVLKRRQQELKIRIEQGLQAEEEYGQKILLAAQELFFFAKDYITKNTHFQENTPHLKKYLFELILAKETLPHVAHLCSLLGIFIVEDKKNKKTHKEQEKRLPYRVYFASSGESIKVSKSAEDADLMIKLMPSHHIWVHILTGEGSHVWLEKPKGKNCSERALCEAGILAVYHSKQSRAQSALVQIATRADIEKRKNLPPGKVLVRRCKTLLVKYDNFDLQKLLTESSKANFLL